MTTPDQPQFAPAAPKPATAFYIRQADAIIAGGALIMFLFSFAPFVSTPGASFDGHVVVASYHKNAWTFLTPVLLFVVFAAIALIATALIDTFWHRDKQLVGLHRHHVQVGLALYCLITLIAFALADKSGLSFGWGGVFMVIGSLIAAAGAILNHFSLLQGPISLPQKSTAPAAYQPPQGYAPPAGQQGYAAPPTAQQGYTPPAPQSGYPPPPANPDAPTAI